MAKDYPPAPKISTARIDLSSGAAAVLPHIRTKLSRIQIQRIITGGIYAINGMGPDTHGFAKVFYGAIGHSLFTSIHVAFTVKSLHGTDELGFKWIDLKPETKAYQRMDARVGIPLPGPKYRPTLTRAQDAAWRRIYAAIMRKRGKRGGKRRSRGKGKTTTKTPRDKLSSQIAAGTAWIYVKEKMDAHPLIELCPPKKIPLLVKTHRLIDSLEPNPVASDGAYRPINSDQIWRVSRSELTLGTRVPYAGHVDRLRLLWPQNISIWMDRATDAGRDAIIKRLIEVLT